MLEKLPPVIMVIAPDTVFRTSISNSLERVGFTVIPGTSNEDCLAKLLALPHYKQPNVVVIDSALQNSNKLFGMPLASAVRSEARYKTLPIIMLFNKDENVIGREQSEADIYNDYLIKPFSHTELVSKIKDLLTRDKPMLRAKNLFFKGITIDLMSYKVKRNSRDVHLGPTEFKILQCLIESPTKIFSREAIMKYVWKDDIHSIEKRTVDVHINRLRAALKEPHEDMPVIKTVRSAGYCLELAGNSF